jgi:hypothetical protein
MKRIPQFRATFLQFPWARIEPDGTFAIELFKAARLEVLGSGPSFGYWSVSRGFRTHDAPGIACKATINYLRPFEGPNAYIHDGEVLLGTEWPTDTAAWKLLDEKHIPHLFFTDEFPPPSKIRPGEIKDWASWYKWRGLSMDSPAALLMDFPMSVYHLLSDILNVIDPSSNSQNRQKLEVHYLGAEVELNFLPL